MYVLSLSDYAINIKYLSHLEFLGKQTLKMKNKYMYLLSCLPHIILDPSIVLLSQTGAMLWMLLLLRNTHISGGNLVIVGQIHASHILLLPLNPLTHEHNLKKKNVRPSSAIRVEVMLLANIAQYTYLAAILNIWTNTHRKCKPSMLIEFAVSPSLILDPNHPPNSNRDEYCMKLRNAHIWRPSWILDNTHQSAILLCSVMLWPPHCQCLFRQL